MKADWRISYRGMVRSKQRLKKFFFFHAPTWITVAIVSSYLPQRQPNHSLYMEIGLNTVHSLPPKVFINYLLCFIQQFKFHGFQLFKSISQFYDLTIRAEKWRQYAEAGCHEFYRKSDKWICVHHWKRKECRLPQCLKCITKLIDVIMVLDGISVSVFGSIFFFWVPIADTLNEWSMWIVNSIIWSWLTYSRKRERESSTIIQNEIH